jgi:UDP-N-acetylmuramyl pentapeptide phosphotransferase/UDP-N-acetylglucosamine-1-phosphate transferase
MLPAAVALGGGFAVGGVVLKRKIRRLRIDNYRGKRVYVVGGVVIAATLVLTEILVRLIGGLAPGSGDFLSDWGSRAHLGTVILALGFFALGFLDDYAGDGRSKGFRGHLKALVGGEVTTGAIKAFGGLGLAFAVSLWWEGLFVPSAVLDALVIALTANFINLLDLRPGRAAKGFLILWVPAAVAARNSEYLPVAAAVVAALLAWLPADLREKGTLGDSGANMIGAVLGAGFVVGFGVPARLVVLVILLALTLASERISFTKVIDRVGPLRWLDGLGTTRAGG